MENTARVVFKQAEDFEKSAEVIRQAFITVAEDFYLTRENAPTNPAFLEADALKALYEKGVKLFDVYYGADKVGFSAMEKAPEGVYYLEKLAVLPDYRHKGIGRRMMDFIFETVRGEGGKKVSIAVINENTVLKQWYLAYGFEEKSLKKFPHLPFTVCFMEKNV
jgi:diamine N-acetyltransferase